MKSKYIMLSLLLMWASTITAQETYENTKLIDNDLNGTARYVGMGGALDALGADISVISSNPAGIGMISKSRTDMSMGLVSQFNASDFKDCNTTNHSFNQIGFVFAMPNSFGSSFNLAVNYYKSRNFDYILSATGKLNNASQNTLSFLKSIYGEQKKQEPSNFYLEETNGIIRGTDRFTSQLDNLYYNNLLVGANSLVAYNTAYNYTMNRANTGYIGTYDVAMSGNINERIFLGGAFGFHSVHYSGYSEYTENLMNATSKHVGSVTVFDERKITGLGVDFKLGLIFLPIENSPFRMGVSIATPTFYDLTTSNITSLKNLTNYKGKHQGWVSDESYNFKVFTPWKFGLSFGHTIGNYLALGASYDYADYSNMVTRVNEGGTYDWYTGSYYESSSNDENMNNHTKQTLKGVSTLKFGAELRPLSYISLRVGYNYVSPIFKTIGYKDGSIDSYGSNYSSSTDYINWHSTHRYTFGFGVNMGKLNIDVAYQYSAQSGDFHPFMDAYGDYYFKNKVTGQLTKEEIKNYADAVKVNNKRQQLLLTFGYRF